MDREEDEIAENWPTLMPSRCDEPEEKDGGVREVAEAGAVVSVNVPI